VGHTVWLGIRCRQLLRPVPGAPQAARGPTALAFRQSHLHLHTPACNTCGAHCVPLLFSRVADVPTFCSTPTHSYTRRLTLSACAGSANRSAGIRSSPPPPSQHPRAVLWSFLLSVDLPRSLCCIASFLQRDSNRRSLERVPPQVTRMNSAPSETSR
jgi:hypothetical protein